MPQKISLAQDHAHLTKRCELFVGFDAFGNEVPPEALRQPDDCFDDCGSTGIHPDVSDIAAVDLDDLSGNLPQVVQRRETGTEVVECDPNSVEHQLVEGLQYLSVCVEEDRLRHLEHD